MDVAGLFRDGQSHRMNYCTRYPVAHRVRDYLEPTLNISHLLRFQQTTTYILLINCVSTQCRWYMT
jgi:hypothetical protein